jgi:hypothetical protein
VKLLLARDWKLLDRTIGRLYDRDEFLNFTGEDPVRKRSEGKQYGNTAIWPGTYKVILSYSSRFKRVLPEILDVPDFTGIRIHGANSQKPVEFSTLGCVCVGASKDVEGVYECAPALSALILRIKLALLKGGVTITVGE